MAKSLNTVTAVTIKITTKSDLGIFFIILKEAHSKLTNMAQKTVRKRMAEVLTNIHSNFGVNQDGTLSVILSREDLASLVGTATESAIRVLSQFKKEGLISTIGKQIKIEDLSGLKHVE